MSRIKFRLNIYISLVRFETPTRSLPSLVTTENINSYWHSALYFIDVRKFHAFMHYQLVNTTLFEQALVQLVDNPMVQTIPSLPYTQQKDKIKLLTLGLDQDYLYVSFRSKSLDVACKSRHQSYNVKRSFLPSGGFFSTIYL